MITMDQQRYADLLKCLYGTEVLPQVLNRLLELIARYRGKISKPDNDHLTERDAILITYGDQVRYPGLPHLRILGEFCDRYLKGVVSGIHLLPFFPWSSDDGFSIIDYRKVDPALGDWTDVKNLAAGFRLMVDGVVNHVSSQSEWFQAFLRNEPPYRDFFITVDGNPDLSTVIRPRTLPLLTEFQTTTGARRVWTTFSADQVDLNFQNPDVLLEIFDILFQYIQNGAQFIRLDAIAYLWKEIGTTCLHLPQTHVFIQLFRAVLDEIAPHVRIITETNVPHKENITYFGDGSNEAQLVYNFALPPLVLHTLLNGDSTALTRWAAGLYLPSGQTTFFNFLASHDGIGLNPARGILSDAEIEKLIQVTFAHGGRVSYKNNPDGTQSPYEMNINYFDALNSPSESDPPAMKIDRFMAAQAIMLAMKGVPGIYFHSLFGSRGWNEGVIKSGQNRSINREKLEYQQLENDLNQPGSRRVQIFSRFRDLLLLRAASPAFHPFGKQEVIDRGSAIFAVWRISPDGQQKTLCLQNITACEQPVDAYLLAPYQTLWINSM
jgi:glycosidase